MSALQFVRIRTYTSLYPRHTPPGIARHTPFLKRIPQSVDRRSYVSKSKEKEDGADAPEAKPESSADDSSGASAPKSDADDAAAKLQTKQDEILDLTVRTRLRLSKFFKVIMCWDS